MFRLSFQFVKSASYFHRSFLSVSARIVGEEKACGMSASILELLFHNLMFHEHSPHFFFR